MSMAEDTRKRPDFSSDYSSNTPRESGSDPLAELARLIGQSDPFTDIAKHNPPKPFEAVRNDDRPAPEWLARPAGPEHDDMTRRLRISPTRSRRIRLRNMSYTRKPAMPKVVEHADTGDYPEPAGGYDHYPPDERYRVALPTGIMTRMLTMLKTATCRRTAARRAQPIGAAVQPLPSRPWSDSQ